jgi:hypothetical protein
MMIMISSRLVTRAGGLPVPGTPRIIRVMIMIRFMSTGSEADDHDHSNDLDHSITATGLEADRSIWPRN